MKENRNKNEVKLTSSKISNHVMVRVVTKYGKYAYTNQFPCPICPRARAFSVSC